MKVNGNIEWLYHLSPPHSRLLITHLYIPALTMTAEGRSGGDRLEWPGGGAKMEGEGEGYNGVREGEGDIGCRRQRRNGSLVRQEKVMKIQCRI